MHETRVPYVVYVYMINKLYHTVDARFTAENLKDIIHMDASV